MTRSAIPAMSESQRKIIADPGLQFFSFLAVRQLGDRFGELPDGQYAQIHPALIAGIHPTDHRRTGLFLHQFRDHAGIQKVFHPVLYMSN